MKFWWNLPREPANLEVRSNSIDLENTFKVEGRLKVTEQVYASVKQENKASIKVLKKAGFELYEENYSITH